MTQEFRNLLTEALRCQGPIVWNKRGDIIDKINSLMISRMEERWQNTKLSL